LRSPTGGGEESENDFIENVSQLEAHDIGAFKMYMVELK
jgi:hypothetical protein